MNCSKSVFISLITWLLLVVLVSFSQQKDQQRVPPTFPVDSDYLFSQGNEYYRVLHLDQESNVIYVGAMNNLYKLWMFNINDTENTGGFEYHCQNHIRLVIPLPNKGLYICSTNAYSPVKGDLSMEDEGVVGSAICGLDPNDNGTAVWVENGNPSGIPSVYSATVADKTQTNRIIYRPELIDEAGRVRHTFMRTVHTDSKWLNEDVFKVDGSGNEATFYGAFTTGDNGFTGSAICSYTLSHIDRVLDHGHFKEQTSSNSAWLIVLPDQVPSQRPGQCVREGERISDTGLHFIKTHPLLSETVTSTNDRPLFHKRDLMLNKIVVDVLDDQTRVVFAGARDGSITKVVHKPYGRNARTLAHYNLPTQTPVTAMQLLHKEFLYVAQDSGVWQLKVGQCRQYQSCSDCSIDPYCAWNNMKQHCARAKESYKYTTGWVMGDKGGCESRSRKKTRLLYPGDSVHLDCPDFSSSSAATSAHWTYNNHSVAATAPNKYFKTVDGGLIIVNVSREDSGSFNCYDGSRLVISHQLYIDDVNCSKPANAAGFMSVYREWCREFQEYKSTMNKWKQWYSRNVSWSPGPSL